MLINCVAYEGGRKLMNVEVQDIDACLRRPECFVWVALRDPTVEEMQLMQTQFQLHDLAVEDALHGHQRPKMEEYGDMVFVVLHLLEMVDGELRTGEVAIFAGPNFVLSVRSRSPQHFLGVRERCEREPQLLQQGSGFVFYALIDAVVDRYFPLLDAMETELERIESQIFRRSAARWNIEQLYVLKHKTAALRHAVLPALEFTAKLHGGRVPQVCAKSEEYFRDVHDHLARISTVLDSVRDTISTAIQVNMSMATIEESETTKRLAAWAAIFAVSTALAGIWGMNFEHMPELKWAWGYPLALSIIAASAGVLYWRFRRAGWL